MRLRSIALLLLLALALRLGAGPHPCHAAVETVKPAAEAAMPSCHGSRQPAPQNQKEPAKSGHDCCDPQGDHSLCEKGCQRAAVLSVGLSAPSERPFRELTATLETASTPAVAFPIDHVPLG